jgi:hypothetical protein
MRGIERTLLQSLVAGRTGFTMCNLGNQIASEVLASVAGSAVGRQELASSEQERFKSLEAGTAMVRARIVH